MREGGLLCALRVLDAIMFSPGKSAIAVFTTKIAGNFNRTYLLRGPRHDRCRSFSLQIGGDPYLLAAHRGEVLFIQAKRPERAGLFAMKIWNFQTGHAPERFPLLS